MLTGDPYVPVSEFFAERSVFITGATGFLGKVLVEKLLRSCPGVKVIYLLIRPKRGRGIEERLADLVNSPVFDRLRNDNCGQLKKLVGVCGDVTLPDLGLSPADLDKVTGSVSVVFLCASYVNFLASLRAAVEHNVLGTKHALGLSRKMAGLVALVHVSTCYSNCDLEVIDEVVYPPPYDPELIVQCTQWMDDQLLTHMTTKLIGKHPDTYTFTKAIAESLLQQEGKGLPIAIVRPSIVSSSLREPSAGWVEGHNGATGLLAGYGLGFLRYIHCNTDFVIDLIPVDLIVNLIICSAWRIATSRTEEIAVFNGCSAMKHPPLRNKDLHKSMAEAIKIYPYERNAWLLPAMKCSKNGNLVWFYRTSLQILPAYAIDAGMKLFGKTTSIVAALHKVFKAAEVVAFFTNRQWRFRDYKTKHLITRLSEDDRKVFYFDVDEIDWPTYINDYIRGIRKHVLKENPNTLPQTQKRMKRLRWSYNAVCLFIILLLLVIILRTLI